MTKLLYSIAGILFGNAFLMMGLGVFSTLISVDLVQSGTAPLVIGLVQSSYYFGFILGAIGASHLVARLGHGSAYAALAAVVCCATLGHVIFPHPLVWALLRMIEGACMAGLFTVIEGGLHLSVSNSLRGRVFSFYLTTAYLASSLGQNLLKLAEHDSTKPFILIACLFVLSLVPIMLAEGNAQGAAAHTTVKKTSLSMGSLRELYRVAPLGIWGALAAGTLNGSFYSMMPVFMRGVGYSVVEVSGFMGGAMIAALALQWPIGRLSDRMDRGWVLFGVGMLGACLTAAIASYRHGSWLKPMVFVYVSLSFTVYGLVISYVNDLIADHLRIATSASLLMLFSVGGTVGPTVVSGVMTRVGPTGYFVVISSVMACLAVYALQMKWRDKRIPVRADESA
ncbi:MFS transporter [Leeia oryzae]|uniref:MFS transporter n=1 Tax=Leeia oryzae TaxID=356662 RepID=UPI0014613B1E|nr:MFS transporter [Leeia oryzae]